MKKTVYLILVITTLLGCSSSEESTDLQIRISNVSDYNFEDINVNTTGDIVNFGDLNSNSKSDYKIFNLAYKYAFIEFLIDGETFTIQPIDYVGETPLENGKYSYEINIDPNSQFSKIILELKVE
jgi:hypothetical protein